MGQRGYMVIFLFIFSSLLVTGEVIYEQQKNSTPPTDQFYSFKLEDLGVKPPVNSLETPPLYSIEERGSRGLTSLPDTSRRRYHTVIIGLCYDHFGNPILDQDPRYQECLSGDYPWNVEQVSPWSSSKGFFLHSDINR